MRRLPPFMRWGVGRRPPRERPPPSHGPIPFRSRPHRRTGSLRVPAHRRPRPGRHRHHHRTRRQVPRRRRGQLGRRHARPALRLQRHERPAVDGRQRRHDPRPRQVP
ncbi:hypothetical protein SGPA1_40871 [Streptomyces misionensis JCM 4497]